jgi:dTMP kinase
MKSGIFVAVDGPNGSGKSTFCSRLAQLLKDKDPSLEIVTTQEPSSTSFGSYVKKNEGKLSGEAYAFLICADRSDHLSKLIMPALRSQKIVICDRYIGSTFVLQGFDGVSKKTIWRLNKTFVKPDLYIFLCADPSLLKSRLDQRKQLSAFEQRISRPKEAKMFLQAENDLKKKGFLTLRLPSDSEAQLANGLSKTSDIIDNLIHQKS